MVCSGVCVMCLWGSALSRVCLCAVMSICLFPPCPYSHSHPPKQSDQVSDGPRMSRDYFLMLESHVEHGRTGGGTIGNNNTASYTPSPSSPSSSSSEYVRTDPLSPDALNSGYYKYVRVCVWCAVIYVCFSSSINVLSHVGHMLPLLSSCVSVFRLFFFCYRSL